MTLAEGRDRIVQICTDVGGCLPYDDQTLMRRNCLHLAIEAENLAGFLYTAMGEMEDTAAELRGERTG